MWVGYEAGYNVHAPNHTCVIEFQCHAQLGKLKWECSTEQRKDTEMSHET